jgi:hypothetical protein
VSQRLTPHADDQPGLVEAQAILAKLQGGGLILTGLRLKVWAAVPTTAPGAGSPNVRLVNDAGTLKFYAWHAATAAWQAL